MGIASIIDIDGFDMNNWDTIDHHRDSSNVKIIANGNFPCPIREIGKWEVINPLKVIIPEFEEPGNRHLNVRINYPINRSDKIVYNIKDLDDKEVEIPEGISIYSTYGHYSTEYILESSSVAIYEKLTLRDNDISVQEYPEFYSFIQSIIDHKKKSAILIK
jgi:hypothetical protein